MGSSIAADREIVNTPFVTSIRQRSVLQLAVLRDAAT